MDISGPLPFSIPAQAAKAYGVRRPVQPSPPANAAPPTRVDARLIAGTVRVPADPSNAPTLSPQSAFAMYTRAADRIEIATKVALGASIDTRA
ncbi:MAG: hypothetical protein SGJ09_03860 [Phycisphaerae bacterium]|nr:hypothetical protein [Phycisphaerae bacterium]